MLTRRIPGWHCPDRRSATVDSETLRLLKDWLVEHIVKDDTAIGDFMKRQAVQRDKDTPLPS